MLVGYSMLTAVQPWLPARTSLGVTRGNSNCVDLFDTWQQQQPLVGSNFSYNTVSVSNSISNSNSHLSSNNKPKPPLSTITSPSPSLSSPSPPPTSSPDSSSLSFFAITDSAILAVSQSQQLTPLPIPPKSLFPLPFCFTWFTESKVDPETKIRVQKKASKRENAETAKIISASSVLENGSPSSVKVTKKLTETRSHSNLSSNLSSSMDQLLVRKSQSLTNLRGEEVGEEEEEEEEEEVFEEAFMTYEAIFDGGFYDEDFNVESESELNRGTMALEVIGHSGESVTENGTEKGSNNGTELRTWSAHMQGFHSLWRGLRAHIRAAARRQEEGKVKEEGEGEGQKEEERKPLKTSSWAMAALLDWRREESEKQKQQNSGPIVLEREGKEGKEGNRKAQNGRERQKDASENLKGVRGLSTKCRECELGECEIRGEGEVGVVKEKVKPGLREVERVRVVHTKETMQEFLSHSSAMELRTVSLMSTLCDLAYMIPQIKVSDLYRLHRLHFVTSSLAVKAEAAAKEKEKGKEKEKEKLAKTSSQTTSKSSLSDGSDFRNASGKKTEEGGGVGGGVSPSSTAYSFAAAAASFLQTQSMAFLPMGTSNEKQKNGELLGVEGEENFGSGSRKALPSPAFALQTMEEVEGLEKEGRGRGGEELVSCFSKEGEEGEISEMGLKKDGKANEGEEGSVHLEKNTVQDSSLSTSDVVNWIELSEGAEREAEEIVRARETEEVEKKEKTVRRAIEEEERGKQVQREKTFATAVVLASEAEKGRVGGTPVTCPCEWFICDKPETNARYIVIQGSDSLASWHTNISFDPIIFEGESLGVMVHRGIYEAAQALYDTLLPYMKEFVEKHGADKAKFFLTGHSLGGSLATLLNLMLHVRGGVPKHCLESVFTFGAPSIMCGGDHLLDHLKLPHTYVKQVIMARDLVPRAFSCDYPDHVAEVLRRMSSSFRDHPCLLHQRLMYAPMGTMIVLQPDERQAPPHPLLPDGSGLYLLRHPQQNDAGLPHQRAKCRVEVRAAQRAVLNNPHPLEILADPGSYGSEGGISRDHDPRNYTKAVNGIIRQEARRLRKLQREQRRQMWWPLVAAEGVPSDGHTPPVTWRGKTGGVREGPVASRVGSYGRRRRGLRQVAAGGGTNGIMALGGGGGAFSANGGTPGGEERELRCRSLIASQHVQLGLLVLSTTASLFSTGPASELISLV